MFNWSYFEHGISIGYKHVGSSIFETADFFKK